MECSNYRGISMLSVPGNVYARILETRLRKKVEDKIEEHQSAFKPGRSVQDHIFTTRQVIEKVLERNIDLHLCFLIWKKHLTRFLSNSLMTVLRARSFAKYGLLQGIYIRNFTRLEHIEPNAFEGLHELRVLVIVDCLSLQTIGPGVFGLFQNLDTLRINKCALTSIPDFSSFETRSVVQNSSMYDIDLSSNKVQQIRTGDFSRVNTFALLMENNLLTRIEDWAFSGAIIKVLNFKNNRALSDLGEKAFSGIQGLDSLDLSKSQISNLPTEGLINIKELVLENTPSLKQFPSVFKFSRINIAKLTYPHHCCAFRFAAKKQEMEESSNFDFPVRTGACASTTTLSPAPLAVTEEMTSVFQHVRSLMKRDVSAPASWAVPLHLPMTMSFYDNDDHHHGRSEGQGHNGNVNQDNEGFKGFNKFGDIQPNSGNHRIKPSTNWHDEPTTQNETKWVSCGNFTAHKDYSEVVCTPRPNAFNPCEDVMGYEWLRVLVWFVLLAALCGNLVVMIVLITARSKLTVPKFLMCNLSFADFLMGLYLLLIASVDVHSLGEYFTHAVTWQNDGGCQVAGFLTVFSSELSVFVLTVITLERWYAISQAIHVNKRLRMRQATFLMLVGWIYASSMGILPLLGVSGYGAVSMCLPMEAKDVWDIVYIVALLVFNGVAFVAICGCYISMFLKVRASENMARSNDATIAKRMAILVLTNFICWAPIAFFGLTASFGFPLIDITKSKILLVFFYPFNSCANPFLYAILTKQFRRDVFILLGRYGICTERANKYKGTSMTRSYSNSRNNGLVLNAVHNNATDVSLLSQYSKLSKGSISLNGIPSSNTSGTPRVTPQDTPQDTPCTSPKAVNSPVKEASSKSTFFFGSTSTSEARNGKNERKLSTVIETSHASDGPSDDSALCVTGSHSDDRILEARDSLRDLFDGKPHGRVRSASEYVVIFRASSQNQQQQQHASQPLYQQQQQQQLESGRSISSCSNSSNSFQRQASRDTVLSSNTLSSFLSDSSSSRVDSDIETRLCDRKIFPVVNGNKMYPDSRNDSCEKRNFECVPMKLRKSYLPPQDMDSSVEAESLLNHDIPGVVNSGNSSLDTEIATYRALSTRESMDSIAEQSIDMEDIEKDNDFENGYLDDDDDGFRADEENDVKNQNYISINATRLNVDEQSWGSNIPNLVPSRASCLTSHRIHSPDRRVSFCDDVKTGQGERKKTQSESKGKLSLFKRNGRR